MQDVRWSRRLEIEPENVEFLVARLEQYRVPSWGLLGDRMREARRLDTARRILKIDPDNAHAHEELGRVYIRRFLAIPQCDYDALCELRLRRKWAGVR